MTEARREANDIINRAQKVAQEARDADIAATREELERMRQRATSDIEAEKQRAIADLRAEVADLALAAAGKVIGESMTDARQRRLVEEFLEESAQTTERTS
jgi:F-type H+-transporting ATPase subunit b